MVRAILLAALLLISAVASATEFPRPPEIEPAVQFWTRIFTDYSEKQTILHDPRRVDIIYAVLDFRGLAQVMDEAAFDEARRRIEADEQGRLQQLLQDMAAGRAPASEETRRIRALFAHVHDPDKFARAGERVRGQYGLREKFQQALSVSGRYLPYMERRFEEAGLPPELSRIPFVESSFNVEAYSRSGAAGVWQFMPSSARTYMRYDEIVDERRDPWRSTDAAVAHLADDYALLQDWGLAVTAYNFGRNGVARALEDVGGQGIEDLLRDFDGPRWGFASRNFYAEFLAALEVERNAVGYFGPIRAEQPLQYDVVESTHYIRYSVASDLSGLGLDAFAELNPAFSDQVRDEALLIPPGYPMRVPQGRAARYALALAGLDSSERFRAQRRATLAYTVRAGDTLSALAQRFGVAVDRLMASNSLSRAHLIRVGQTLTIPAGAGAARVASHRVQPGDNLSTLARRYGVSVGALRTLNALTADDMLKVGQILRLPSQARTQYVSHQVRDGQTVSGIAARYGVSTRELVRLNRIHDVNAVQAGQWLKVPAAF